MVYQNIIEKMNQSHLIENKSIYLKQKSQLALQDCFERCNKGQNDYKTVSNRQLTCIEYCSVKLINAYSYAFDVLHNGGIYRAPESDLRFRSLLKS